MKCANCHAQWEPPKNKIAPITKCPFCGAAIELPEQEKLDSFRAVIASITSRFGVELLLDGNKTMAYFVDLAPTLKKERQMLQYLLQCDGNTQIIQSLSSSADEQIACRHKISARMIEDFFIGKEIAEQICDDFLVAIGGKVEADDPFATEFERAEKLNQLDSSESDKKEAFLICEKLANSGYIPAQIELSTCYRYGKGCDENTTLADQWLDKAIQSGSSRAMYAKAFDLELKYEFDVDNRRLGILREALAWYTKAAEKGECIAENTLGNIYSTGKSGCTGRVDFRAILSVPDWDTAFYWYSKAAEGKHTSSLNRLGQCYEYGLGTTQDLVKALDYYHQSAGSPEEIGKGNVDSIAKVALFYELGLGAPRNHELAYQWHQKALYWAKEYEEYPELHPFLHYYLGYCYINGIGVPKDFELAVRYMQAANKYAVKEAAVWIQEYDSRIQILSESIKTIESKSLGEKQSGALSRILELANDDFLLAQICLGACYKSGSGCEKDIQKSFEWYSKAADNGSSKALFCLSIFYKNGEFVAQDFKQELHLLRSSAEKGYICAQTRLGALLLWGDRGAQKNEKEAVKWLENAANHGDSLAQWLLADCKRHGWGTSVDLPAAVQLYQKAADQGDAIALYELGNCYSTGIGVNQDISSAAKWYTKAAEAGNKDALFILGKWYADGVNLEANMDKARMYMTSASEKGVTEATQWLAANPQKDTKPKWAFWKKSKS